ncbi:MAG: hypothetical protein K0R69_1109 [Clostridia bacterium]|jgi:DNA-binding MurR/RpiR family transcriptional regulator|nr:hypothetical protein [Clostridia bacterium]
MSLFYFDTENKSITTSQKKIIDYIYKNRETIPYLSIEQLSNVLGVSNATLSRFCKQMGYSSFKDLKFKILESLAVSPDKKLLLSLSQNTAGSVSHSLDCQIQNLLKTKEHLSEKIINQAIAALLNANTIYLFGKGASSCLVSLLGFRLTRFGKNIITIPTGGSEIFESLANLSTKDLVIVFGFQKMPMEARVILDYCKKSNYPLMLFTDMLYNEPGQLGDITLYVDRGSANEYHSMSSPIALIDALIVQFAQRSEETSLDKLSKLYQLKQDYANQIPR